MKRIGSFLLICIGMLACSIAGPVLAQEPEFGGLSNLDTQGTAYHVFAKPGEATMQIIVLGTIGAPGIYVVGVATELDQLLALTGGTPLASSTGNKTEVTVRLFREGAGRRDLVYEAPFERVLTEPGLYPSLNDGDVLTVETITIEPNLTFRDVLGVVTSLSTLVLLIERFAR